MRAENKTSSDVLMMPDHFLLLKQKVKAGFFAAVVPDGSEAVIVLKDGRVVALDAVVTELVLDTGVDVSTEELLDAAIRVAEEEA